MQGQDGRGRTETVSDVGEKWIVRNLIAPLCGEVEVGIGVGDDGAVIDVEPGHSIVLSTDRVPENLLAVEFGVMDPYRRGRYLAEVNVSDVAAMGGVPRALLVNLGLPDDFPLDDLRQLIRGVAEAGRRWSAPVVGGDTSWSSSVSISATAIGVVPRGEALTRSGTGVGDELFVTGTIGGFGAGLAYLATAGTRRGSLDAGTERCLLERLTLPTARVEAASELRGSGQCSACMDITDGLGQSLRELQEASGLAFRVEAEKLPIDPAARAVAELLDIDVLELAFGIGLDLELLGTLRGAGGGTPDLSHPLSVIGVAIEAAESELVVGGSPRKLPGRGWQHFQGSPLAQVRNLVQGR